MIQCPWSHKRPKKHVKKPVLQDEGETSEDEAAGDSL